MKSDTKFRIGATVYWAEIDNANLSHQPDGVNLFSGTVIEDKMSQDSPYIKFKEILYHVGKYTYAGEGRKLDPVHQNARFSLYGFINSMHYKIFKKLEKAQKDMIVRIFEKEKWL
jgi:hypothetical protein